MDNLHNRMRSRPLKFQNQVFWYKSKCQCWKLQPHDVTLACQFQHSNLPFTVSCIFKHIYIYCTFTVEMKEKNRLDELLFGSNSYIRMNDVSLVEILIDNFLTVCFYIYICTYKSGLVLFHFWQITAWMLDLVMWYLHLKNFYSCLHVQDDNDRVQMTNEVKGYNLKTIWEELSELVWQNILFSVCTTENALFLAVNSIHLNDECENI